MTTAADAENTSGTVCTRCGSTDHAEEQHDFPYNQQDHQLDLVKKQEQELEA